MTDRAIPRIAVIVGAFSRERYIVEAIESVLHQTIPRDQMEILVTKNFRSPAVDELVRSAGARGRLDDEPRIGKWWLNAIQDTRAPLVTFLDDDDQYAPERLARVLEVFEAHPEVGYYRNRLTVIDQNGAPIPEDRWEPHQLDQALDGRGPMEVGVQEKVRRLSDLRSIRASFNNSSIVIRRELVTVPLAHQIEDMAAVDKFYFAAGVLSPYALFLDDRRTTRYREHPHAAGWGIRTLKDGILDAHRLAIVCQESGQSEYAAWFELTARYIEKSLYARRIQQLVAAGCSRRDIVALTRTYIGFLAHYPRGGIGDPEVRRGLTLALTAVLSPALARDHARESLPR